jgi:hypothetical protein
MNITAASANRAAANGSVQGTVSSVDVPSATVFVLGQTVHVTQQTVFSSAGTATGLSALHSGMVVEVNGFADSAEDLNGQRVLIDARTQLTLAVPFALDDAVEVTGTFDTAGVLVAASVQTFK